MYLLDTNILRLFIQQDPAVLRRVAENFTQVWASSVAVEETIVGRLSEINKARSSRTSLSLPQAHAEFIEALADLRQLEVFVYSEEADAVYRQFPARALRRGQQDCRIAAQAMAHGLTVITRNLSDFEAIGAPCEDWSA